MTYLVHALRAALLAARWAPSGAVARRHLMAVLLVATASIGLGMVLAVPRPTSPAIAESPPEVTSVDAIAAPTLVEQPTAAPLPTAAPSPTAAPTGTPMQQYVVRQGDTVQTLAARFGIGPETLVDANTLSNPDLLRIGQELLIPPLDGAVHRVTDGETIAQTPAPTAVAARYSPPLSAAAVGKIRPLPEQAPAPRRVSDEPPPDVSAQYVAILDEASGELLFDEGARERLPPASTTKIATTIVAIERATDLRQVAPVTVSGSVMAARDGSSIMGLEPGERVSLLTLLYGMMLPSGNDAAEQVALSLAGSRERYVAWMNARVESLGLENTHFANPSGMDARGHYSSAYDMALLARHAMSNEAFRSVASAARYRADGYDLRNLNRLIGAYPGADGVKIGYTRAAGRTTVASATHEGQRVYVSLMRSQDLPGDSAALFNWVWRTFRW